MDNIINKIIDMICKKDNVKPEDVRFSGDNNRFWIDVLDSNFSGDFENGDPVLKQYHLVETTNDNIDNPFKLELDAEKSDNDLF